MITDLLTSSKGPGVIGTLLALVVLIGFGSLMFLVSQESSGTNVEFQIKEKQQNIITAENRITKWETEAAAYKENRKQKSELESLQRNLERRKTDVVGAAGRLEEAKGKLVQAKKNFEKYKEKYRIAERAKAAGETMTKLDTKDNKTYEQVKIIEVTAIGINIMHKAGNTRVAYQRLPDDMQDRFQFTKEGAQEIVKVEQAQVTYSEERAESYYKAVAIRDLRTKVSQHKEDISRMQNKINTLNGNIRSYQGIISSSDIRANKYRSLYAQGRRGMTLDNAKKAERKATLYRTRSSKAQNEISSMQKKISTLNLEITKLEREIQKKVKSK